MSLHITDAFDSGNIEVLDAADPQRIRLEIRKDNGSDFYQWFHFRVTGARGSALTVSPGCGLRAFELDHVFGADASQEAVFEAVGARDRGRGRRG